jgi:hypothetical protein
MQVLAVLTAPIQVTLKVEEIAAAMIDIAFNGWEREVVLHEELKSRGQALLKSTV